ncbi:MAG: hypothetical protein LUH00_11250, partial [Lachnospiraceae bacterium]|nr:hypothetical protein [Lachnospiraceae bacterium]
MAKNMLRRMLSFVLVFALLAPTLFELPVFSITARAATELALSVEGLSASYETSGSANSVWSADGNKLSYAGNSYTSGCGGFNHASCTLTLTNTSGRPGLL